jgi:hypothetical protein
MNKLVGLAPKLYTPILQEQRKNLRIKGRKKAIRKQKY